MENFKKLPVIALRSMTILPDTMIHFDLIRKKSILAAEQAMSEDQEVFLVTQCHAETEDPQAEDLYQIGCIAKVKQVTKLPDNLVRVLVEGVCRGRLRTLFGEWEWLGGDIEALEVPAMDESRKEAMLRSARDRFTEYCKYYPRTGRTLLRHMEEIRDPGKLMDQIIENIPADYTVKQKILEQVDLESRFEALAEVLATEVEVARIRTDLTEKVRERVDKNQKDYILREQLKYIQEELGEDDASDAALYEEKLQQLKASKEVKEKIAKEISRFKRLSTNSAESGVERAYIETLLELPWDKTSRETSDLTRAEEILDRDHYGLEQVKERMLEFLAVRALTKQGESPIICLVGPPGTGKTSIARSVAEALNKKYVRISLGGVHDEAEIRGHRRTYVAAMPGRIAQAIKKAGVINPLMLLDELDKMGSDSLHGDVSSAMLEVLDPEQNATFTDHYLEVPLDLSDVLFVATANNLQTVPQPLLDRMEIIEVSSYTEKEKYQIASRFLLPKQIEEAALPEGLLRVDQSALEKVISGYTKEAGVRGLERQLAIICRKAALKYLEENCEQIEVTPDNLSDYLGRERFRKEEIAAKGEPGIVRGLAWTSVGGVTLEVEVNVTPGKGQMKLTGKLGDVMKESAQAALSCVQSVAGEYGIESDWFETHDIHIHIPEGAVPKDGPSAGITMATAILSAVTNRAVRPDVAMTGEITLRGRVLAIGGLKEKLLAAKAAGATLVFVPADNRADYEELTDEVTTGLCVRFVTHMREVIKEVFEA